MNRSISWIYAKTITSEVTGHISVVAALKLNVVESSKHIEYVNICYGDTYNFRGKYISQTGVYSDSLVNVLGCDSIVELHLTVLPNYEQTFNATIKEGEIYSGYGVSIFRLSRRQALQEGQEK